MISTANITMQFGAKPLFENVSVKFGGGNRYGLIGANGCGKSTFMKILGGDLVPTAGNVSIEPGERLGKLHQDQFAFENYTVVDTVIMGHAEPVAGQAGAGPHLRPAGDERRRRHEGRRAGDPVRRNGRLHRRGPGRRAAAGCWHTAELHSGLMSEVAPGWKLRVLLAQALFADPDILLLDEPTNNLDINTIRWLEEVLNARNSTMIIISHDRHFLNSVCTHMADLDYGELRVYPGNYDEYMTASTQARERRMPTMPRKRPRLPNCRPSSAASPPTPPRPGRPPRAPAQIEKIQLDDIKPSSRVSPYIRFDQEQELYRLALEVKGLAKGYDQAPLFSGLNLMSRSASASPSSAPTASARPRCCAAW